jgi:hypothetical protein
MGQFKDLTGQKIGWLTVRKRTTNHPTCPKKVRWECVCVCGRTIKITSDALLRKKNQQSCGCKTPLLSSERFTRHGESRRHKTTTEYRIWSQVKARCFRPSCPAYPRYGGRGITMCERWRQSFEAFIEDMGRRPSKRRTLDRINNDGNYEPGNCRWATRTQQANNRRLNIYGRKLTESDARIIKSGIATGEFIPLNTFIRTGDLERMLGARFNVTFQAIRDIRNNRTWRAVNV